tara:strand:- start:35 stop:220 length:186 start_codon:yes stop_codon:yes gene_type:complete
MLYILPIICTFGFSGSNSFKSLELPLYQAENRCFIKKDMYLSLEDEQLLNKVEENIFEKKN